MPPEEIEPRPTHWPDRRNRPRVLVETDDVMRGWVYDRVLTDEGFDVAVCPGPSSQPDGCPLLHGRVCPLAEGADTVILASTWLDGEARRLLRKHESARPDLPVVLHATGGPSSTRAGRTSVRPGTTWANLVRTLRDHASLQESGS